MLEVQNLEVVYDRVIFAVKGVSIKVPEGGIVAVLGPNGSGKTTILRAVAGILKSQKGDITFGQVKFDGQSIADLPPDQIRRLGLCLLPERGGIFDELTVDENLRLGAILGPSGDFQNRLEKAWDWFPRLKDRRKIRSGYLSGGEQQMLALARVLLARPRFLMLDEPSLGLAPIIVDEIFAFIKRLNAEENISVLIVEQNAARALSIASYAYVLENGKTVLDGGTSDLLKDKEIKEFYLGIGGEGTRRNYRNIKHYKRRKRWLS